MPKQGSSFTNHAGITDFNGSSYFFYHNGALPGGGGFTRSVAVEKFTYNTNGTFPTINMSTSGAPQAGTLNPYITNEAETMAWASGVETEPSSEGGMNVGFVDNGDYIKVKGVNFGSGAASFEARVASATSGGNIELRLDSSTGTLVGTCSVQATGGWQTWVTRTCTVSGATGTHDLYLKFTGGSSTPPAARRLPPHAPQLKSLGRPTLQRRSLRRQRGLRPQVARRTPPHAQLLPAAYPQIPPPTLPAAARLAARSHPPSAHPLPTMARGSSAGNRPTWEPTSTRGTPTASRSTASTSPIYTLPPARTRPRSAAIGM
jgi:hypothetical protein